MSLISVTKRVTIMIKSFKSKKLKNLFINDDRSGIKSENLRKVELILTRLNTAKLPNDMNLPGLRMHQLKGEYYTYYAVMVNKNWRIIFKFDGKDFFDVDYLDYH